MSTVTIPTYRKRPPAKPERSRGSVLLWAAVIAVLAVLAVLAAWLLGWIRFGTDPRVAEIRALQEEARAKFIAGGGPATIAEATAAFASMGQIREKIEALPEDLRPQAERSAGNLFRSAFRARIDAYFATPPEKRQAELDRHIDQEEMLRKASAAARALTGGGQESSGAGERAGGGQGGGGQANGGQANGGQANGGQAGGGGSSGPGRSRTEEDRNAWRKRMIDRTTPEQRARYVEYRRAIETRRGERGLPAWPGSR
jgi:hypothetical protein